MESTMRTTPESFAALVTEVLPEARRIIPRRLSRITVDHRDHCGAVPLFGRGWFGALRLRRKHLQALAPDEATLRALILYAIVHEEGRRWAPIMPECCLNKLAPWPANVRCP